MTEIDHLLTCLIEECSEVQKAATKALRFGLNDTHPRELVTNRRHIMMEFNDVVAIVDLLVERGVLQFPPHWDQDTAAKKAKVADMLRYSEEQGRLQP